MEAFELTNDEMNRLETAGGSQHIQPIELSNDEMMNLEKPGGGNTVSALPQRLDLKQDAITKLDYLQKELGWDAPNDQNIPLSKFRGVVESSAFNELPDDRAMAIASRIDQMHQSHSKGRGLGQVAVDAVQRGYESTGSMIVAGARAMKGGELSQQDREFIHGAKQASDEYAIHNPRAVAGVQDIHSVGDALKFGVESIGENLPRSLPSIGGAVAGGILGPVGAKVGSGAAGLTLNTGEALFDQIEEGQKINRGLAIAQGAGYSVIDAALGAESVIGGRIARRVAGKSAVQMAKKSFVTGLSGFLKETGKAGLREGITEPMQSQIVGRLRRKIQTGSALRKGESGGDAVMEGVNEAVGGLLAGLFMGGGEAYVEVRNNSAAINRADQTLNKLARDTDSTGVQGYDKLILAKYMVNMGVAPELSHGARAELEAEQRELLDAADPLTKTRIRAYESLFTDANFDNVPETIQSSFNIQKARNSIAVENDGTESYFDPDTGILIRGRDGQGWEVINNNGLKMPIAEDNTVDTLHEAIAFAQKLSKLNQWRMENNASKAKFITSMAKQAYPGVNVVLVDSITAIRKPEIVDRLSRDQNGNLTFSEQGFYNPGDNTVYMILDKVQNPAQAGIILQHEDFHRQFARIIKQEGITRDDLLNMSSRPGMRSEDVEERAAGIAEKQFSKRSSIKRLRDTAQQWLYQRTGYNLDLNDADLRLLVDKAFELSENEQSGGGVLDLSESTAMKNEQEQAATSVQGVDANEDTRTDKELIQAEIERNGGDYLKAVNTVKKAKADVAKAEQRTSDNDLMKQAIEQTSTIEEAESLFAELKSKRDSGNSGNAAVITQDASKGRYDGTVEVEIHRLSVEEQQKRQQAELESQRQAEDELNIINDAPAYNEPEIPPYDHVVAQRIEQERILEEDRQALIDQENEAAQQVEPPFAIDTNEPSPYVIPAPQQESVEESAERADVIANNPTEAQKEAGNYKKLHIKRDGLDISVENPVGSTRSGKDNSGKAWSQEMKADYGYIRGTVGYDKDHLDIFIKPGSVEGGDVYVVNQVDPKTGKFDEHKVMIGYSSEEDARQGYLANYEKGWKGEGSIVRMSIDDFKEWAFSKGKNGPHGGEITLEPWQMTQSKWAERLQRRHDALPDTLKPKDAESLEYRKTDFHRSHVWQAVKRGDKVSAEVLAAYPDLLANDPASNTQMSGADEMGTDEQRRRVLMKAADVKMAPSDFSRHPKELTLNELRSEVAAFRGEVSTTQRIIDDQNDIRFRRSFMKELAPQSQEELQHESTPHTIQRKIQQYMINWIHLQDIISKKLGVDKIPEEMDVVGVEDSNYGFVRHEVHQLEMNYIRPAERILKENSLDETDLDQFLMATFAPERNKMIEERTSGKSLAGSGLTDVQAQNILEAFKREGKYEALSQAAEYIWKMNRESLQRRVDAGLITQDHADYLLKEAPHYAPLRSVPDDEISLVKTKAFRGKEFKRAKGRGEGNLADSPFVFSQMQAIESVTRAANNRKYQTAARLVSALGNDAENKGIGFVVDAETVKDRFGTQKEADRKESTKMYEQRKNVVIFKENGNKKYIVFEGEGGTRLARALTKDSIAQVLPHFAMMTRFLARMNTSFVPSFILRNFRADIMSGSLNITADAKGKVLPSVYKNLPKAWNAVWTYERDGKASGAMAETANEYFSNGGQVAGYGIESFESIEKTVKRRISHHNKAGKALSGLLTVEQVVDRANATIETGTRLAVYTALRDSGMSINDAVKYSKNVTVNFNRKGEWGPVINSLWMFSGASIQATTREAKALMLGKYGRRIAGGIMAAAFFTALFNNSTDDEDKEKEGELQYKNLPEHEKQRNIVVRVGDKYIKAVPLRGLYAWLWYVGTKAGDLASGNGDPVRATKDIAMSLGDTLNFLGTSGSLAQLASPTVTDPVFQQSEGIDWKGHDLYQRKFNEHKPDSSTAKGNTPKFMVKTVKKLNSMTGGDDVTKGLIDMHPETIKLWVDFIMGGVGRDLSYTFATATDAMDNASTVDRAPIVRDFVRNLPDNTSAYYNALDMFNEQNFRLSGYDFKKKREVKEQYPFMKPAPLNTLKIRKKRIQQLRENEEKASGKDAERIKAKRLRLQALFIELIGS